METNSVVTRRQFLHSTTLGAASLAVATWPGMPATPPEGVPEDRLNRLASGANICRWFRFPRNESPEHFGDYIPESEAEMMARLGLRHVRLCVAPRVIMDSRTGAVREDRARFLEAAIERLQCAGLLVMVNMHNEDRAAELNPEWQEAFVRFWGTLAGRLAKYDSEYTMFETINEPVFDKREDEWNTFNARLVSVIRRNAPGHTIVTSGPNWGGIDGLNKLTLLPDRNVVFSFHCYDPFPFTHQGATWSSKEVKPLRGVPYPSSPEVVAPLLSALDDQPGAKSMLERYGRERWNKEKLAGRFQQGIEWGARHRVPLYCGEFGVYPRYALAEHRANWFRDFGEVLAANKIGWGVWGWDEGFGLDRRKVDGKPKVDNVVAKALGLRPA